MREPDSYEGFPFLDGKPRAVALLALDRFYPASACARKAHPHAFVPEHHRPDEYAIHANLAETVKELAVSWATATNTLSVQLEGSETTTRNEIRHRVTSLWEFVSSHFSAESGPSGFTYWIPIPEATEAKRAA